MENLESSSIDAIKQARLDMLARLDPLVEKYVRTGLDLILISTADNVEKAEKLKDISRRLDAITREFEAKSKSA